MLNMQILSSLTVRDTSISLLIQCNHKGQTHPLSKIELELFVDWPLNETAVIISTSDFIVI